MSLEQQSARLRWTHIICITVLRQALPRLASGHPRTVRYLLKLPPHTKPVPRDMPEGDADAAAGRTLLAAAATAAAPEDCKSCRICKVTSAVNTAFRVTVTSCADEARFQSLLHVHERVHTYRLSSPSRRRAGQAPEGRVGHI